MSKKVAAPCPKCGQDCEPFDTVRVVPSPRGQLPLRLWRYTCEACDWTWANELQRKHNDHEYDKALRGRDFECY